MSGKILSYQWYSGSQSSPNILVGETSKRLSRTTSKEGTTYYFIEASYIGTEGQLVTNLSTSTSRVRVTVAKAAPKAPVITAQPVSITVKQGDSVQLSVEATSPDGGTIQCQWYSSRDNAFTGSEYGVDSSAFCKPETSLAGSMYYYCEVMNVHSENEYSAAKSKIAKVTVVQNMDVQYPADIAGLTDPIKLNETYPLSLVYTLEDSLASWSVDNTEFATIDALGNFKTIAPGKVTITATLNDGQTITKAVSIQNPNETWQKPWMWAIPITTSAIGISFVIYMYIKSNREFQPEPAI
jgi:hypothetical protein